MGLNLKTFKRPEKSGVITSIKSVEKATTAIDCSDLFNCCDCGGNNCGCDYCSSCNYCESCKEYEEYGTNPNCENKNWNK